MVSDRVKHAAMHSPVGPSGGHGAASGDRPRRSGIGDFCQRTYHLARLLARLRCRASSHIAGLCSCCRSLKTTENPSQSGTFFSGNRLGRLQNALDAIQGLHQVLLAGGDGQTDVSSEPESRSGNQGDPGALDEELGQVQVIVHGAQAGIIPSPRWERRRRCRRLAGIRYRACG